jgi:hypothetical protein
MADQFGFGIEPNYKDMLARYVKENEQDLRRWVNVRPTIKRTYDQLVSDIQQGIINFNPVPRKDWKQHLAKETSFEPERNVGAFFRRKNNTIHFPEDEQGVKHFPHEIKHYFASHTPGEKGGYGTPQKINPYIKADMKLKGWLPSLHPGGRRPTLPEGPLGVGEWWNKKMATKDVEYSNKYGYHPWFDEHAFDKGEDDPRGLLDLVIPEDKPIDWVKTKGGDYPIYEKESKTAQTFRDAFSAARHGGEDIFEWQGRKYTTEVK